MSNRNVDVKLTQELYDQVTANAMLYNKVDAENVTLAMAKRCECELYELQLMEEGRWQEFNGWAVDGVSEEYGHVDCKTIVGSKPWWNISKTSMRNICRQHGVIDHYYFLKITNPKTERFEVGETVKFEWTGVLSYAEVMKYIQCSSGHGYYVDTRKAHV